MNLEKFKEIIFNDLGFCGCGDAEQATKIIYEILKSQQDTYFIEKENILKIIFENLEVVADILLYVLNNANLLEHGSSINCSWQTLKAKEFINFYENIENKEDFL